MTREEIIDGLEVYTIGRLKKARVDITVEELQRFIDAIKALEQLELCEDAVSRKDCLKALSNMMDTDGFRNGLAVSRANVECMLKSMPPVTPKQRTGHWIPVGMVEAVGGESAQWGSAIAYHKCSECNEQGKRSCLISVRTAE